MKNASGATKEEAVIIKGNQIRGEREISWDHLRK